MPARFLPPPPPHPPFLPPVPGGPRSLRHTAPDQTRLMRDPPPPQPVPAPPLPPTPQFRELHSIMLHAGRVTGVGRACCRSGFCPRRHRNQDRPAVSPPATRSSGTKTDRLSVRPPLGHPEPRQTGCQSARH